MSYEQMHDARRADYKEWKDRNGVSGGDSLLLRMWNDAYEAAWSRRATSGAASGEVESIPAMCEFKTDDLVRRGYRKVGYIMLNADNTEYALSDSSVRWLSRANYLRLMHEQDDSLFATPAEQSAPPVPPMDQSSASSATKEQAMVDLMPKRAAFLVWAKNRALDVTEDRDAWGERKFLHSHVQALWDGWFNAPATYATPDQPSIAGAAKGGITKDHVIREVVNNLRDIAIEFHAAGQLRQRLAYAIEPLLATQSASTAPGQAESDVKLSEKLANNYVCGSVVSDFQGPKVTLRYQTTGAADAAFDALTELIDARSAQHSAIAALSKEKQG